MCIVVSGPGVVDEVVSAAGRCDFRTCGGNFDTMGGREKMRRLRLWVMVLYTAPALSPTPTPPPPVRPPAPIPVSTPILVPVMVPIPNLLI